jgi:tetratricopeptide (TPR) repeat protein
LKAGIKRNRKDEERYIRLKILYLLLRLFLLVYLKMKNNFILFVGLLSVALAASACDYLQTAKTESPGISALPPAAPLASDDAGNERAIRFLENKVKNDPEDSSANNKLAEFYLQKLRETGNAHFLDLAFRAARASLASVPEVRNASGLAALAQAEFAAHEFVSAKENAVRLAELEPRKSYPQGILGDALLELGEYDKAAIAYKKIVALDGGISHASETRFARLAQLKGDNAGARKHLATALTLVLNQPAPPRETVAWLRWQSGETAFSDGDYEMAEKNYLDALVTFPDYYRAGASLGRIRAAQNDLTGAIEQYEKAVLLLPDPQFIGAGGEV